MPRLDLRLNIEGKLAIDLAVAGETARAVGNPATKVQWTTSRLESLYELAFLRMFIAWETCNESVFLRSLCGYASQAGQEQLVAGNHYPTLAAAEAAMLGNKNYVLWHNPYHIVGRCKNHIQSHGPQHPNAIGRQEAVIASSVGILEQFANVRHRIAHGQKDAKAKFDQATLSLAGRTYLASRPGKFLRDYDRSKNPPQRFIEVIFQQLIQLAKQIV